MVSGEGSLPGLQKAAFLLCPHRAERERGSELSNVSTYKDINPIGLESLPFMTSFNLNYFLSPNTVTFGVRAFTFEF